MMNSIRDTSSLSSSFVAGNTGQAPPPPSSAQQPSSHSLPPPHSQQQPQHERLNLFKVLIGNCYCADQAAGLVEGFSPTTQFVVLHGIRFIGLGCMADELTPVERVYDTLEQLTDRSERLISIGHVVGGGGSNGSTSDRHHRMSTATIPLDVWNQQYTPKEAAKYMARPVQNLIDQIKNKDYRSAKLHLSMQLAAQKKNFRAGNNRYLAGITAHNLAVVKILLGGEDERSIISLFEEAIDLKEQAFGSSDPEVAYSWDELGVQLFANNQFEDALDAFTQAQKVRRNYSTPHDAENKASPPQDSGGLAMVLNNMACCNFQLKNFKSALLTLQEARVLQQNAMSHTAQFADLDLLYSAIVMCNCGYLHMCLKLYDEARSLLEEALLIQQSVLEENHRAIRDTRSNLEFTNAFHL